LNKYKSDIDQDQVPVPAEASSDDSSEDSSDDPQLFEDQIPISKANFMQRCFFTWIGPAMSFAQKHQVLKLENYGTLRDQDRVELQINRLRKEWNIKK